MIIELTRCPTRQRMVYFANNEQASIPVFTAVFCFTHANQINSERKVKNFFGTFKFAYSEVYLGDVLRTS